MIAAKHGCDDHSVIFLMPHVLRQGKTVDKNKTDKLSVLNFYCNEH